MARVSKLDAIDNQIKKKQERLFSLKEQSDIIAEEIQELVKQKEAIQKATLLEEMKASGRTYEEIVEFLRTAPRRSVGQQGTKRKYNRKKAKSDN